MSYHFQLLSLDEVANIQHENKASRIALSSDGKKYLATATNAEPVDWTRDERHLNECLAGAFRSVFLIKEACERLSRPRDKQLSYCAVHKNTYQSLGQ